MPIQPISADKLYYKTFKPSHALVEGIIPKGLTVLAGSPKIGKSWMALDLAIAVASGGSFLGRSVKQTGVFYLCLEDTEQRIQKRMYELTDEAPSGLYFSTSVDRIGNGFTKGVVEMIRDHPEIELVIVDTLQKVRKSDDGSSSGSYGKDYEELAALKRIADLNDRSILVIHHLRKLKDKNDPFNEISGSTAISGASDTNMVLRKLEGSSTAELYIRGRDVEERKFILEFNHPRWTVAKEFGAAEVRREQIPNVIFRIEGFIKEIGSWSGSATELLSLMDDHTVAPNKLMQHITSYYYEVLYPSGIRYEQKREAGLRRITFTYDPTEDTTLQDDSGDDDSDGSDGSMLHPYHSLPSEDAAEATVVANTCV